MAVPGSGTLSMKSIAQEALYGTYGSGTITNPISLYDMVNGGQANGSGNNYPTVNTACLPNPADRNSVVVPTLTTSNISSITTSSATSGGTSITQGSSAVTAKGIQWSTASNFSIITGSTSNGSGTANFTSSIVSLSPNTTYYVRAYAISLDGTGYGTAKSFQSLSLPVTGLSWTTTVSNSCNSTPWVISAGNQSIKYNISDSYDCGGSCTATQAGTATATITVGSSATSLNLNFEGIGELQDANFEKIEFKLNGTLVAKAQAAGGNLGCQMGPVVKTFITNPPYALAANSTNTLFINFTTNDGRYHKNAYYEVDLSFN